MSDNVPTYISPFKIEEVQSFENFGELGSFPHRLFITNSLNNEEINEPTYLHFKDIKKTDVPGQNHTIYTNDGLVRFGGEEVRDASGTQLFYSELNVGKTADQTHDYLYKSFIVRRIINNQEYANGFYIRILDDGTKQVTFTAGDNITWRNALGASNGVWTSSMIPDLNASKITAGTIARARIEHTSWAYLVGSSSVNTYCRWRMVAGVVYIEVNYTSGAGMSASTKKVFATMPAGYRPTRVVTTSAYVGSTNNNVATLWVESTGAITGLCLSSATAFYGSIQYPI